MGIPCESCRGSASLGAPSAGQSVDGARPLWGTLEPGPYGVGFRVIPVMDHSRVWDPARDAAGRGEQASNGHAAACRSVLAFPDGALEGDARALARLEQESGGLVTLAHRTGARRSYQQVLALLPADSSLQPGAREELRRRAEERLKALPSGP